ncbi:MAG: O-antigen ligase family protein [Planctomycetota bacterium]
MPYEVIASRTQLAGRLLETASLFVLLAVIGLRPLVGESYDLAGLNLTAALEGVSDPLPLHTLLIDAAILAAALGWAVGHGLQPQRRYRWCGLEAGLALVLVAVVASCAAAGHKRVALNASVDWVSMALIAVVLVQVLRERRRVRLALCVIVASAAVQAYQCFDQVFYTFPETERLYEEQREAFWQAQGVPLDSAQVISFEKRMWAREASGYLAHSNVAGAYLVLTFFAALGAAAGRLGRASVAVDRIVFLAMCVVAVFLFAATLLTHSFGAMAAGAVGFALAVARRLGRGWIEAHRRPALLLGWALVGGGVLAVVAHGRAHGSLPGASLNFRWGYWTASSRLIANHPWTGVGRENFGDAYLKYKPITAPEEVKNPHNFLVAAAAEWGVPGLLGVLAMLVGGSITATRPLPESGPEAPGSTLAIPAAGHPRLWMLLLALCFFGVRLHLLGSDNRAYWFVETVPPAMVWLAVFAVCAFGPDPWRYSGRDGWLRMAVLINCGLFAFLLQDTINFALIVPGAATTVFAVVGVAVAARQVPPPRRGALDGERQGWWRWGFATAAGLALALVVGFIIPPVWRATDAVVRARAQRQNPVRGAPEAHPTDLLYRQAVLADPLDPTAAAERAEWLERVAESATNATAVLREASASMAEAIARSPANVAYHRARTGIILALARLTHDPVDRARALEEAERAIALYPARPESYIDLANLQVWVGRTEERAELVITAVTNYRRALDLNAQRPAWEEIRRFSPARIEATLNSIAEAEAWLAERPN